MTCLATTTCKTPFRIHQRPAGDFAVDRFNRQTQRGERVGVYRTREIAQRFCDAANQMLAGKPLVKILEEEAAR